MTGTSTPEPTRLPGRLLALIGFVVVVACYLYDPVLGIRATGINALVGSAFWVRSGRIPYGIRGWAPAGYLTGWPVVALSLLMTVTGLICLLTPHQLLPLVVGK